MTTPELRVPRLSSRSPGLVRSLVEGSEQMKGFSRRLEQRYRVPKAKADEFLVAISARALDSFGELKLSHLSTRLTTLNELRAQIGEVLDSVLSGKPGRRPAAAQNLQALFGKVTAEIEGLQKELQERELSHVVDELSEKLKRDIDGTADKLKARDPKLKRGRFYEPEGFLRGAYDDLAQRKPSLHAAFERARADNEAAAFLQKAIESGDDATQPGLVAQAKARMQAQGMSPAELADLEEAVKELGRARKKALVNNPQTIPGRQKLEVLKRIEDEELRKAVDASDFILLPAARDEFGGLHPVGRPGKPSSRLLDAWKSFKEKNGIADGQPLTGSQRSGFAQYWRSNYQVTEARPALSEITAAFETGQHEGLNILKQPDANPREGGTDFVGFKDDSEIWVVDDKAHRATSVSDVSAFTEKLAQDVLDDVADMEAQIQEWSKMATPDDPMLQQKLAQARQVVGRYKDFGQELLQATKDWKKGEVFETAKSAEFVRITGKYRVKLKVTSALGKVTEVSERLGKLDIGVWTPPVKK